MRKGLGLQYPDEIRQIRLTADKKFDELARTTRAIGPGSFFYRCH